jgi:site-specific DNA-methyltransferase (adenine-specific)
MNFLYFGDCLDVLRNDIKDESVDLIYIDPPFNSKRNYNIFFDDKDIQTQRVAFEDTWSLKNIQDSLSELMSLKTEKIHRLLNVYSEIAPSAFPYLVMMALRIIELHRVLKPTGSFYLHCDPTMSHYLKTLCDAIFGKELFRNEIIWERNSGTGSSKNLAKKFPTNTDTIFFYSKSENYKFSHIMRPLSVSALKRYDKIDENGKRFFWADMRTYSQEKLKRLLEIGEAIFPLNAKNPRYKKYLDETKGTPVPNLWYDIEQIGSLAAERMGYPTQKPKALLERIINASSAEGDTILDAFCGCGTTVDAAEGLKRNWIGIDISPIAISLIRKRLNESYGKSLSKYDVRGIPKDEASAIRLWQQNPFAFQDWWITEFCAFSTNFGRKGADKGIDGIAKYLVGNNETIKAAFQVKGGKVQSKDTDALLGAMDKHHCGLGVFLSIQEPTKPITEAAASAGFAEVPGFRYPRLQILTLTEFFSGKQLKLPQSNITFETAKLKGKGMRQAELL